MHQSPNPPRACCQCHLVWPTGGLSLPWVPGWEHGHGGWWCANCHRTRKRHIEELAAKLLRSPGQPDLYHPKDIPHRQFGECWHCDVIRQALNWTGIAENRPWARQRLQELRIDHLIPAR